MENRQTKINTFERQLMLCDSASPNPKEQQFIDELFRMLSQTKEDKPLDSQLLADARHKTSCDACFSESYFDVVRFLTNYQENYLS